MRTGEQFPFVRVRRICQQPQSKASLPVRQALKKAKSPLAQSLEILSSDPRFVVVLGFDSTAQG
jgi:hypothetical protein